MSVMLGAWLGAWGLGLGLGRVLQATGADIAPVFNLWAIAPGVRDSIRLTVQTSDLDGDPLTVTWTVKEGLSESAEVVGTLTPVETQSFHWWHDREGEYYVHIRVEDGQGGASQFTFNLFVRNDESEFAPDLEFNSLPTVASNQSVVPGMEPLDLDEVVILLSALTYDPDGESVHSIGWESDCISPVIADEASLDIVILPITVEVCTATFSACDTKGCHRFPLIVDMDCPDYPLNFNPCDSHKLSILSYCGFLVCCPVPEEHACVVNDWECGEGLSSCGMTESCGECPDAGICEDHVCIPDGDL